MLHFTCKEIITYRRDQLIEMSNAWKNRTFGIIIHLFIDGCRRKKKMSEPCISI